MGWKIRSNVPSDKYLEDYDKRVAEREAEIRRPGRSAEIEAWRRAQAEEAKAHEEFLKKWTAIHVKEIRRRNKFIRYELFLFFKVHYHLEDEGARDLSLRALAAVCKSITRDVAIYCQLISGGGNMGKSPEQVIRNRYRSDNELRNIQHTFIDQFSCYELGMQVDEDDALSLLDAYQNKTLLSKVIESHLRRDLEDVSLFLDLATSAPKISGLSDPNIGSHVRLALSYRVNFQERNKQISVDEVHKTLENIPSQWDPYGRYTLTPEQIASAKSALDTAESIQAFNEWFEHTVKMYSGSEWSLDQEGLLQEKTVLSSILDDEGVKKVLLQKVLDLQFNSNMLVSATASIRNQICEGCLSEGQGFDTIYAQALEKHAGFFKEPQKQDADLKKLFGLDVDKAGRDREFGIFFEIGFY